MFSEREIAERERKLGYTFKNKKLLEMALTHRSYANENIAKDNQRLEFLGDSVLSIIVSTKLFFEAPEGREGVLTKLRASLVSERGLLIPGRRLGLGDMMQFSTGEIKMGGRNKDSVIADAFEAVLAAIYLDGGMEAAEKWLMSVMGDELHNTVEHGWSSDYKSELLEWVQKYMQGSVISYEELGESGPPHNKRFHMAVCVDARQLGDAVGRTKQAAEQDSASQALAKLRKEI